MQRPRSEALEAQEGLRQGKEASRAWEAAEGSKLGWVPLAPSPSPRAMRSILGHPVQLLHFKEKTVPIARGQQQGWQPQSTEPPLRLSSGFLSPFPAPGELGRRRGSGPGTPPPRLSSVRGSPSLPAGLCSKTTEPRSSEAAGEISWLPLALHPPQVESLQTAPPPKGSLWVPPWTLEPGPLGALLPLLLGTLCDLEQVTQLLFVLSFLICEMGALIVSTS